MLSLARLLRPQLRNLGRCKCSICSVIGLARREGRRVPPAEARDRLMGSRLKPSLALSLLTLTVLAFTTSTYAALSKIPDDADVILAYEPVWAIGASEPAGADHVVAVTQSLRALVAERKGRTRILYGGSAGPGTYEALKNGVDGLFLGRFAHDPRNLEKVIQELSES